MEYLFLLALTYGTLEQTADNRYQSSRIFVGLGPNQRVGDTMGRVEDRTVQRSRDQRDGDDSARIVQETQQTEQRSEGLLLAMDTIRSKTNVTLPDAFFC